ncbi:MAG: Uma2 family endonuclease [Oscillospiraceae bacterium]|nr:Uma2 family endonuclease [Oscillospiraceae bacterium]
MQDNLARVREYYTYEDYLTWNSDSRYELVDGLPHAMSAPTPRHQEICGDIYIALREHLNGRQCKVYQDINVRLFPQRQRNKQMVFRPDLSVICDQDKLDNNGCNGAPDLIIEVLSPGNQRHDRYFKFNQYYRAGVREYWIVDPENQLVQVCLLEENRYYIMMYHAQDNLPCTVLPGLNFVLSSIFPTEETPTEDDPIG